MDGIIPAWITTVDRFSFFPKNVADGDGGSLLMYAVATTIPSETDRYTVVSPGRMSLKLTVFPPEVWI